MFGRTVILWACCTLAAFVTPAWGADPRPSWQCIPGDSIALVRAPSLLTAGEAFHARTKLGALLFNEERISKLIAIIQGRANEEFAVFERQLAELNLKLDDWRAILRGELGSAVTVMPRDNDRSPVVFILAWLEPGEDLAERLWNAADKLIEQNQGIQYPPKRLDRELGDITVMHLTVPITEIDDPDAFESLPEDFGKLSPDEVKAWFKKQQERLAKAKRTQTGQAEFFFARLDGRLLLGILPPGQAEFGALDNDQPRNFSEENGSEDATRQFAEFLAAHHDDRPGIAQSWVSAPGMADALAPGIPFLELFADLRPLVKLIPEDESTTLDVLKRLGLLSAGPFGLNITLDDTILRSSAFLGLPAEREGLFALFEAQSRPASIVDWVTTEPYEYQHIEFDLAQLYRFIREVSEGVNGDQAKQAFEFAEMQTEGFIQTDIASLLGSLGKKHVFLQFLPKVEPLALDGQGLPKDPDLFAEQFSSRLAIVWNLQDEPLWKRILEKISQVGGVPLKEEQGFSGMRSPAGPIEGGLFVGRGYLVLGIGQQVTEKVLAALRSPPQGPAALVNSPLAQRAQQLLPPESSISYSVVDGQRIGPFLADIMGVLTKLPLEDLPGGEKQLIDQFKNLLPTPAELDGLMGAAAGQVRFVPRGLLIESASELPGE